MSILASMFSSATSTAGIGNVPKAGAGATSSKGLLERQRRIIKKLVETPFQQGWQFRVDVDSMPADFDIYVKDITHGGLTIEFDSKQIGAQTFNMPTHKTAGKVTVTVRDHEDGRIEDWFRSQADKVLNKDGTVNLPPKYLFKMRFYRLMSNGSERLAHEWLVSAAEYGEVPMSREGTGQFVSFPMSFQKFAAFNNQR